MTFIKTIKLILMLCFFSACTVQKSGDKISDVVSELEIQLRTSVDLFSELQTDNLVSPRSAENSEINMVKAKDWTSGFFSGELWMMYELTGDKYWKEKATEFTLPLEDEKWNGKTHDMGFKMYCSFGKHTIIQEIKSAGKF